MNTHNNATPVWNRRNWLVAALGLSASALPLIGHTDDDDESSNVASGAPLTLAQTGLTAKVVVVGGGMAGATAAKYLRLWGGAGVQVTLVEPNASYTSNIMSNLVLNGTRNLSSLGYGYSSLSSRYGVLVKQASVLSVDTTQRLVTLTDNSVLSYDRLVVAPGIEFMDAYGLVANDYATSTPHAWQAGPQTTLLAQQLQGMSNGGTFVMSIPKAPYRCPPGPYERACVVADYLKSTGRSASKVVVLDENLSIQAEKHTFETAFNTTHGTVIEYVPGVTDLQINPQTKVVTYKDALGTPIQKTAQVVSPIVPHRARGSSSGGWLDAMGLNNSVDKRWCVVDVLSYESTAVPGVHVVGDAASCGMPKAGHVANQEAKICADAIARLLASQSPDVAPVANSACYSPITASTASWLTVVYQYDPNLKKMVPSAQINGVSGTTAGAAAVEAASPSAQNFRQMGTWFNTLMGDSFA